MTLRDSSYRSKRWRLNAAALFALMALGAGASCAEASGAGADSAEEPTGLVEEFSVDYDSPLGVLGREVADVSATALPFAPLFPAAVDVTARQYVYTPGDPSAAMAAFVYENDEWGQVLLLEYSDTMSSEGLLAEADQKGGGCTPVPEHGDDALSCSWDPFEIVDLGAGTRALVASGPERTSLMWVTELKPAAGFSSAEFRPNDSVVVQVIGDATTLSRAEIVAFGRLVVSS